MIEWFLICFTVECCDNITVYVGDGWIGLIITLVVQTYLVLVP